MELLTTEIALQSSYLLYQDTKNNQILRESSILDLNL